MKSAPKNGQGSNYHEAWYTYRTGTDEYGDREVVDECVDFQGIVLTTHDNSALVLVPEYINRPGAGSCLWVATEFLNPI